MSNTKWPQIQYQVMSSLYKQDMLTPKIYVVRSHTASSSVFCPPKIFSRLLWFLLYCPRGTPLNKDNCSTVRLLSFEFTRSFDSSWLRWFRSWCGCLRCTRLNYQPASSKFLPPGDGFGVNSLHYTFSSKFNIWSWDLYFLSPLLYSREWISWARQGRDQVRLCQWR